MPTDAEQIATIKRQTLALIAEITANPKPTYDIDGQKISWGQYLGQLQGIVAMVRPAGGGLRAGRSANARIYLNRGLPMTLAFDPSNDLVQVADGLEAVTLRRRGSTPGGPGTTIAHALRRSVSTREAAASDGRYTAMTSPGTCRSRSLSNRPAWAT